MERTVKTGTKKAYLRCGKAESNWGYRHITADHGNDWKNVHTKYGIGSSWSDLMLNATASALTIMTGPKSKDNKDLYVSPMCIVNIRTGKVDRVYNIYTPVAANNDNIITSYVRDGRKSDPLCGS